MHYLIFSLVVIAVVILVASRIAKKLCDSIPYYGARDSTPKVVLIVFLKRKNKDFVFAKVINQYGVLRLLQTGIAEAEALNKEVNKKWKTLTQDKSLKELEADKKYLPVVTVVFDEDNNNKTIQIEQWENCSIEFKEFLTRDIAKGGYIYMN